MHRSISGLFMGMGALVLIVGCRDAGPGHAVAAPMHGAHAMVNAQPVSGEAMREIAALRALTARFHRFDVAVASGWNAQITECFDSAEGGMGFHYGNPAYIDGTVNALEPELLLYEPQKNGAMRLVAVEYIVPLAAWSGSAPPTLYGQSFHRNDAFGIWALHVWHERQNPRGMFADWNPNVSCAFAR